MVLYSADKPSLYRELVALEQHAQSQSSSSGNLHFHNFVNNADLVPRLLGTSLDSVHDNLERYISSMKVGNLRIRISMCSRFSDFTNSRILLVSDLKILLCS